MNAAVDGARQATQETSSKRDAFRAQLESWQARMESALAARLPGPEVVPSRLHEAMRYSVLGGGKRIRPALVFAAARAVGRTEDEVEGAACAVELIHVYSLVHDDLPAMDDDDLRRGRPTVHKAYDEATGVLVGDALQTLAFHVLSKDPALPASPATRLKLVELLADASGSFGMAGGQAIDLEAQGRAAQPRPGGGNALPQDRRLDPRERDDGGGLRSSLDTRVHEALAGFAAPIGLAFQIQDDLLDVLGDVTTLGKATGADSERSKPTHPAIIGIEASQERVRLLHAQALEALSPLGARADLLRSLADWLLARHY